MTADRVAVIGPGRVGGALALGLHAAGHRIVAVAGRDGGSAALRRIAEFLPDTPALTAEDAVGLADLVLLTTPDDAITGVAARLAGADAVIEGQRWVHTSGRLGVEALAAVAAAGGRVAACHPAMTVPDPRAGVARLPGAAWAVTASDSDLGWARALVADLQGVPVVLAARDRTLYHAALAVGSNGTTAVVALARDLLLGAGIADPAAFLDPLVTAAAIGGAHRGVEALTGPVRRGDAGTVQAHVHELATSFPDAVRHYVALAELILVQALRSGLDATLADRLRDVLDAADG